MRKARNISRSLAAWLPTSLRQGPSYLRAVRFLSRTEYESQAERDARATAAVRDLVQRATTHTSFWSHYRKAVVIDAAKSAEQLLVTMPTTEKEQIRDRLEDFTLTDVESSHREYLTTGGSSGIPLGFFLRRGYSRVERAFIHTVWRRSGWRLGEDTAVFRGAYVPENGRLWTWDPFTNELRFSGYHLTVEHAPAMLAEVDRRSISYIQAYPSAAVLLSRMILSGAAPRPTGMRGVFLGSETLLPWQRALIERAFDCPSWIWYGHAEAAVFASSCEHNVYHADSRYGILELLDADGETVTEEGAIGEIVATGLIGPATVFMRYRTGDLASRARSGPCECGRPGPLLQTIIGRVQEFVVSSRGRPVSATAMNMHNDLFDRVLRFQFRQEVPGRVYLLLMTAPGFGSHDLQRIRTEIGAKLGEDFELVIERVEQIATSPRGKQRFIDQRLPLDNLHVPRSGVGSA